MSEPTKPLTVLQSSANPTLVHVIMQAVLVCNCDAHLVLMLHIAGGEAECPSCKHKWRMQSLTYSIEQIDTPDGPVDAGKFEFQLAQLTKVEAALSGIIIPGGFTGPRRMS